MRTASALPENPPPDADAARKRCFAPVIDDSVRVLVLGSLPGDRSLAAGQYYGNPQNRFWHLMSEVTSVDLVALAYEARLAALLAHGVGLWDVVAEAHRPGSLDSRIRNRDDNDLAGLLARYPGIRVVAFNGKTAARLGMKALGAQASRYRIVELPSSSPAHTMAYRDKLSQWLPLSTCLDGPGR